MEQTTTPTGYEDDAWEIIDAYERRCIDARKKAIRPRERLPRRREELVYECMEAGMDQDDIMTEAPQKAILDALAPDYEFDVSADAEPHEFWNGLFRSTAESAVAKEWSDAYGQNGKRQKPPGRGF